MQQALAQVGAVIHSMEVPDRKGNLRDIVLGFDSTKSYMAPGPYFGAVVGRVANRLKRGKFTIDGVEHKVICNDGLNSLHGGAQGFDKKVKHLHKTLAHDGNRRPRTTLPCANFSEA